MAITPVTVSGLPTLTLAAGSAGGVAVAGSIDPVNDYLLVYTASATATQGINRNILLGLSSGPVGLTDSQTLTNKILTAPTINGAVLSGTLSGTYTIGGTPTFPASVVTLTGTQALTNKTLTSPTITAPSITNATISADAITGFTTSNTGTIYGVSIAGGVITGAGVIGSTALATNAVQANQLATNAITLGYTQTTANFSTSSATAVQITGLTSTVTIPAGSRRVKITAFVPKVIVSGTTTVVLTIWDGTVGGGTQIAEADLTQSTNTYSANMIAFAVVTPAAGSKTYNVGLASSAANSMVANASATIPNFILVEVI